jgi:hypothetical protein
MEILNRRLEFTPGGNGWGCPGVPLPRADQKRDNAVTAQPPSFFEITISVAARGIIFHQSI